MGNSVKKRSFKLSAICLFSLLVLYMLYMAVLQPILSFLYYLPVEKKGTDLYVQEQYLKFEGGTEFKKCLATVDYIDLTEMENINGFAYLDNFWSDNWLYGSIVCDYFVLDAKLDSAKLAEIKEEILADGVFLEDYSDYAYYRIDNISDLENGFLIVAFNENEPGIKFIFTTTYIKPETYNFLHEILTTGSYALWEPIYN